MSGRPRPVVRRTTPDLVSTSVSCGATRFGFGLHIRVFSLYIVYSSTYLLYIFVIYRPRPAIFICFSRKKGQNFFWKFFRYVVVSIWKMAVFYLAKTVIYIAPLSPLCLYLPPLTRICITNTTNIYV